ncbi:MAG: phosphatase PAP2 family protein [Kiritimatiellae bacterium]|nr:phosphatase PAP2 family protein [Kiritimatiellia bacterium]MDW8458892.1 phosphatase PAP2 family protein [Verrucomicrobiota bacterium]
MSRAWPRWWQWGGAWAYRRYWLPELAAALVLAAAALWLAESPSGDRAIARTFYMPAAEHHWPLSQQPPWKWLNRYAGIGAAGMAVAALALLGISFATGRLRRRRIHLVYVLLVIALGPGIVVNATVKELWGRPRPRQVKEFGGWLPYRSILAPDKPGRGKSFPCGHCSAGFALVALYFIGRRHNRRLAAMGLGSALALGGGMSAARVMSGAHFASDAIMAGVIVFVVAGWLYYAVLNIPAREDAGEERALAPGWPALGACGGLVALIAVGGAVATPSHRTIWYDGRLTAAKSTNLALRLEIEHADITLQYGPYRDLAVRGSTEGFRGLGGSMKDILIWSPDRQQATQLTYRLWKRGIFSEFRTAVTAHVPVEGISRLDVVCDEARLTVAGPPSAAYPTRLVVSRGELKLDPLWESLFEQVTLTNSILSTPADP